ncbi:MAG TPA: TonB family protein [Vicinamibacteria bacterium]|nr:TonB family protein [Vicinamibacteria bacterium]
MHPQKFGRYEVLAEIGDGAMGRVYRAFDPLVRRPVAIKTVKSEHLSKDSAEEYLKRFRREAQAAGGLSHPHIVSVFDVGEDYFVMEYLEGVTLQALIKERGRLEPADALRILAPVADALDYAHRTGIVHRDIKPANIMVLPDGRPKLMDFGVAHLEESVMTAAGQFLGSPSYMAPEQMTSGEVTARSDFFSFAVVAYEVLTGQKPFPGENITSVMYKVIHEVAAPPRKWKFDLPARYDDVFAKALAKNPADRYATAGAFTAALDLKELDSAIASAIEDLVAIPESTASGSPAPLDTVLGGVSATTTLSQPPGAGPARSSRLWLGLGLAAVLALGIAGGVGLTLRRGPGVRPAQSEEGAAAVLTLPPARPSLRIETDPDEAMVLVDGQEAGRTPLSLADVAVGTHQVRVTSEGYAPTELSIDVVEGKEPAPLRFVLQPIAARLAVASEPKGATLRVDGKKHGTTPIESFWVAPGSHELRLELKGFKPFVKKLEAAAGDTLSVDAHLESVQKTAKVTAPPSPTPAPLVEGALVELGPDVVAPRRISGSAARYPEDARRGKKAGTVAIEMIVTEKGEPTEIKVVESAGEALDQAVLEAVRTWRYEPAQKQGIKVKVRLQSRHTFR